MTQRISLTLASLTIWQAWDFGRKYEQKDMKERLILYIEPKPQSRPRFAKRGNFVKAYEEQDMKSWRNHCQLLIANQYMGQPILEGAKNQQALLDEVMPVDKKPDIDNYEKALYDSMSGIVFKDDGQVAMHDVGKFYSLNPRIEVEIEEYKNEKTEID